MMEKINEIGQEEYIWAMRCVAYQESDSELWKERRFSPLEGRNASKDVESINANYHTKLMASLVPDEVINNVDDYSYRHYDVCLLFGDVSGFTDLCEKYNQTGEGGSSRLTQVLNSYIGSMVQEIMSFEGDVLKFSGDAFLAMWKCSESNSMRDAVHSAIDCALVIQKDYGSYQTDVGVLIRVKLAISCGPAIFSLVGIPSNSHYVIVGQPIWEVKAAETKCNAGEVIISPNAWQNVNPSEYLSKEIFDGFHLKILGIGPNWRAIQKSTRNKNSLGQIYDSDGIEEEQTDNLVSFKSRDFSLRPSVNEAVNMCIQEQLKRYIIFPVLRSIEMDEPFEYLTEMRQISVMMINITSIKLTMEQAIALANKIYKIVCRFVDEAQGCLNKFSLFDKDLMFLAIFGLRGLKHETESQSALRCAVECKQSISKLKYVTTTSVGVTTGKVYCGVFGHSLRREYTVISLTVNKAARLMVAYKNKVTCDRETFLHSKMESKNFILQEPKELKGISHPGPIYEFAEITDHDESFTTVNSYPILGRDEEIVLYLKLLEKWSKHNRILNYPHSLNMLIIFAQARQGKTRLMEELIYYTPNLPVQRVSFKIKDSKIPFHALQLIFFPQLGLTLESSSNDKQIKLQTRLRNIQVPDLFCVLNKVFGVNFELSPLFNSLKIEQKVVVLKKMTKQLCRACFVTPWVIAIDDAEYIDDSSWGLMEPIIDSNLIFMIITVGSRKNICSKAKEIMGNNVHAKEIELNKIERSFHCALACQLLDVYAIPSELEHIIQSRSNGNPGWVECFLISALQSGGISKENMEWKSVTNLGLVSPSLYLMTRLNQEKMKTLTKNFKENAHDTWNLYLDCCENDRSNPLTKNMLLQASNDNEVVPVCTISPSLNLSYNDYELSMNVIILKTFDSLSSYEQLLIKCSAILGESFPRDMLIYIISSTVPKKLALALKKLFEIRVLNCGRSNSRESHVLLKKPSFIRRLSSKDDHPIICECSGGPKEENADNLPKYAFCQYLQFRSQLFRETTYNLLTDGQRKEFHSRAVRYLEKETRKCRACGNGFFVRIVGTRQDDGLRSNVKKRRRSSSQSFDEVSIASSNASPRIRALFPGAHSRRRRNVMSSLRESISSDSSGNSETDSQDFQNKFFGFTTICKLKNIYSICRTFSTDDFSECECNLILCTMYSQLIEHCREAGHLFQMLNAMIEYAQICIYLYNIPLALNILKDAINYQNSANNENWNSSQRCGKMYTLLACCKIKLGQYENAHQFLLKAMKEFRVLFPISTTRKKLRSSREYSKLWYSLYVSPNSMLKNLDEAECEYYNSLSECLSTLCELYMIEQMWKEAKLAATWSLNVALKSSNDFKILCVAYGNMIKIAQNFHKSHLCTALEVYALRICHLKRRNVEIDELMAVAKMYYVIFSSRIFRSAIDKATHIGYIILKISTSIRSIETTLSLLPLLTHCLMITKKGINAAAILYEMNYFSEEDCDDSGKIWYYALCICFNLETGHTIIPYEDCEQYYQKIGKYSVSIRDPNALKRYFTVMWLWCVRNENWEAATIWCASTDNFMVIQENDSLANQITALYLLEGLMLLLVCKMDKRNLPEIDETEKEIRKLIYIIEKNATTFMKFVLPRLHHLKAYFRFVRYGDTKSFRLLREAKKCAKKYNNYLEYAWIEHSEKAWNRNISSLVANFWKDHNNKDNLIDYHEMDMNEGKVGSFTLPIPIYV